MNHGALLPWIPYGAYLHTQHRSNCPAKLNSTHV